MTTQEFCKFVGVLLRILWLPPISGPRDFGRRLGLSAWTIVRFFRARYLPARPNDLAQPTDSRAADGRSAAAHCSAQRAEGDD